MTGSTILICWDGTYMACDTADFNNRRWSANTPEALITKLDAEGIDRSRLRLDKWEDGPHDHALAPHAVAEFIAILGVDPNLNSQPAHWPKSCLQSRMSVMRKFLAVWLFLVPALVQAQDTAQTGPTSGSGRHGFFDSIKQAAESAKRHAIDLLGPKEGASEAGPRVYRRLTDTKLANLFSQSDIANPNSFPRVAITITSYSAGVLDKYKNQIGQGDCIGFDARVWSSSTRSESINGLTACGRDLSDDINDVVNVFTLKSWMASGANTGPRRTNGPTPPEMMYPTQPGPQQTFFDKGAYFISSLLGQMGYDYNYASTHGMMHVWIVSVAQNAPDGHGSETVSTTVATDATAPSTRPAGVVDPYEVLLRIVREMELPGFSGHLSGAGDVPLRTRWD